MTTAYPLTWPPGWPRTDPTKRENARFRCTLPAALKSLYEQVRLLGGTNVVLSSNVTLGAESPKDPGVAAYFTYLGDQVCVPCDRWRSVEDNLRAIANTIEAMRAIERWGAKHMMKAAFRAFAALPPPGAVRPWRQVLGLGPTPTFAEAQARYRELARQAHPDSGGSEERMKDLNSAWDAAKRELDPS